MNDYQLTAAERDEALTRAQELRRKLTARAEPTGDLREQMLREMLRALCVDHGHDRRLGGMNCRTCRRRVDVLLALPEVRDALAAQEAVKRVEALAEELTRVAQDNDGITAVIYRQNADRIRRALAGDS